MTAVAGGAAFADLAGRPVVVGSGLAGLATALFLAPEKVVLVTKAPLGELASSPWAQGGLAAALGEDDDAGLHLEDTLAAGDGLVDAAAARRILSRAKDAVADLMDLGARFDRDIHGRIALGLEAAHSRRRIAHAAGDGTGRELVRALAAAVRRTPSVTVIEHAEARRLLVADGRIAGLLAEGPKGGFVLETARVALATGGLGGLFADTTNPPASFGQGLALAARAGAVLRDMEMVQFHPTALAVGRAGSGGLPLVSEAVRGEGALLVNDHGERFLAGTPGAELAPRDVVARAVWAELEAGRQVYLDARTSLGPRFAARFPAVAALCQASGLDPARDLLPIRPAAHYHMGGVEVDGAGRSSVPGLWAVGEVASTGLHGANRLASNSLLEAVVCAREAATSMASAPASAPRPRPEPAAAPRPGAEAVRPVLSRHLGVARDGDGLACAAARLLPLAESAGPDCDAALVGLVMALAGLERRESRGAHWRTDHLRRAAEARHTRLTLDAALSAARAHAALALSH
ncbi:L-aspartate oxidase [Xanthobacter tagetidis]|uniref:L-aspartate oxidase n=1 Tax=Xanthobacter tagetidis TaxID=60216 RepID=A0A3L7AQZ2_9HYPH|nr:L-aspartate oxidase [Xanthobacter tagetidis]MBB6308275.1 L-aspartate oxidase [Xanthobacter tagetidis]RLP81882.1 L-aspartate oxidase [Xanthobacter tagetidis]